MTSNNKGQMEAQWDSRGRFRARTHVFLSKPLLITLDKLTLTNEGLFKENGRNNILQKSIFLQNTRKVKENRLRYVSVSLCGSDDSQLPLGHSSVHLSKPYKFITA